jgi:hypothetical protein
MFVAVTAENVQLAHNIGEFFQQGGAFLEEVTPRLLW